MRKSIFTLSQESEFTVYKNDNGLIDIELDDVDGTLEVALNPSEVEELISKLMEVL